jgi:Asp-tRNA(Asn)/Glu-tRNA(Gln) amidotransferase C subunit
MRNTFRPDVVTAPLDRDEVLAQAPDVEGPYFRIPPVLGEAPETAP